MALIWAFAFLALQSLDQFSGLDDARRSELIPWTALASHSEIVLSLTGFVLALGALYAAAALVNVAIFRRVISLHTPQRKRTQLLAFAGQLFFFTLGALLLNLRLFPDSVRGDLLRSFSYGPVGEALTWSIPLVFSALLLLTTADWIRATGVRMRLALALLASVGIGAWTWPTALPQRSDTRPDVIIIGLDSLRTDHVHALGSSLRLTPSIDAWLNESTVFTDVLTPQPNTFPATVSVLTGLWPTAHGARVSLFPPEHVRKESSIAHAFRNAGYQTLIAMDETRFANIDTGFGFDRLVGPPMGVMDFLMSAFGDNVLSNLSLRTPAGRWLFPHLDGNRGAYRTYLPSAFDKRLAVEIGDLSPDPALIYVHFCGAHYPYRRASRREPDGLEALVSGKHSSTQAAYLRGIAMLDGQFGNLVNTLRQTGRLENAIVTVLSDHGEDFNLVEDARLDSDGRSADTFPYGHGGSAIRAPQVDAILAFRRFGAPASGVSRDDRPASLIDVAPTIISLVGFNLPGDRHFDGTDLFQRASPAEESERIRFVESSWLPIAMARPDFKESEVAREAASMYALQPNGRLQLMEEFIAHQVEYRQRAAYQGRWILATLPGKPHRAILVDRQASTWWNLEDSPHDSPWQLLLTAACAHWSQDRAMNDVCPANQTADLLARPMTAPPAG